jgi:hypothetical protein
MIAKYGSRGRKQEIYINIYIKTDTDTDSARTQLITLVIKKESTSTVRFKVTVTNAISYGAK